MSRRRWPGHDRGSFTAELAAGLPALMLLLGFGITAVTAVAARMQCLDAAREAVLAASRGEDGTAAATRLAPEGATIRVGGSGDSVTAQVSARIRMFGTDLPGIVVRGDAVAAREPEEVAIP
ncbi:TadE family type IV pilus minor pilin [Actinoplanes sp. NPDC023801]|uniref:TadE family type IV pilus minor pilin n=1 Tax=Actinoplanes sp. NPDC023801 TaxID=3154595 RepID=UPI0033F5E498